MSFSNFRLLVPVLLAAAISACTSTLPTKVDVDRKQNLVVPQLVTDALSKTFHSVDRISYGVQGLLDTESVQQQNERANTILKRLIPHVDAISPGASAWDWEMHVVDKGVVNAYTPGAGKVIVYRGLIDHLALTEAELASIIAHEMGHSLRQHPREDMGNVIPFNIAQGALATAMSPTASQYLVIYGAQLPLSRTMEQEADRIGLELMVRAGYPAAAAPSAMRKSYAYQMMSRDALAYKKIMPRWTFLQSHPLSEDRQADLEAQSEKLGDLVAMRSEEVPPAAPLSNKTSVNLDYIDEYEKWYLMSRIGLNGGEVISTTDWGYGWMLRRHDQGGLNVRGGLSYLINDPQLKGFAGGVHAELGWVFNPQWQTYGRALWANDFSNDQSPLQKYSAGVRWGDFNQMHLYLETSLSRNKPDSKGGWNDKTQLEVGLATRFSLF